MLLFFFFNPLSKWWSLSKKNESFLLRCFSKKIKIKIKKIPSFSKKKKKKFSKPKIIFFKIRNLWLYFKKIYVLKKDFYQVKRKCVFKYWCCKKKKKKRVFLLSFLRGIQNFCPKKKKKNYFQEIWDSIPVCIKNPKYWCCL